PSLTAPPRNSLAIHSSAPRTRCAGTLIGGVFKSTDSGANWSPTNTGLTAPDVRALAINPSTPSTLYAGTLDGGVFRSTNSGGTWAPINTGLSNTEVWALVINPITLITVHAATFGGGVFDQDIALLCGNGVINAGEQCDDSNHANGDCCSSTCQFETAGSPCGSDGNACTNDIC